MADWTNILLENLEPGKPARSVDAMALRDNPIAIAQGAAGAPRIEGYAAKRVMDFPVLAVTASNAYPLSYGVRFEAGALETYSESLVVAETIWIDRFTGSIRFNASHKGSATGLGGSTRSTLSLYKNGTAVASWEIWSSSWTSRTIDVTVAAGDVITWRHKTSSDYYRSYFSLGVTSASNNYTPMPLLIQGIHL